jgi:tetratricopeptide (TPR) repeat protein
MLKRILVLLGIMTLAPCPGRATQAAEEDATKIVNLLYDNQFAKAVTAAKTLEAKYPDSPVGLFYESVSYYQRYLLEDPRRPETFQTFLTLSQAALEQAARLMPRSPSVSHYYLGAALGFQARAFVSERKYVLAIPRARQGVAHLKKALALDPSLEDANLGLGMYYYFLDRVPAAAKPFAYLMIGMKGDRQKGLALLECTAEKGHVARVEAKSVLAAIYASEKERRWDDALPLLSDLLKNYPHNPRYRLSLIYVLERKGQWNAAAEMADPQGAWVDALDASISARAQSLAQYRAAENLLFAGRYAAAGPLLDRLESRPNLKGMRDWVFLRRGNYWDALRQPSKARSCYAYIQDRKAGALAEIFLAKPFPAGPRDVMPNRWPLPSVPQ